tara:strand:+ start:703 stop:1080 length:378 start_codon:yes stop_codon:yes gene_type:complete
MSKIVTVGKLKKEMDKKLIEGMSDADLKKVYLKTFKGVKMIDTPENRTKFKTMFAKELRKSKRKSARVTITATQVLALPGAKELKASDIAAPLRAYNKQANASPELGTSLATPRKALTFIKKSMK